MSEMYEAWDGNLYPSPAPDGWSERSDGRWWPAGQGPEDAGLQAAPTPGYPAPAPSAPTPMPQPRQGSIPPPTAMGGGYGAQPMGGPSPSYAPPEKKGMSTGMIVFLVIVAFIVLSVGGCIASAAVLVGSAEQVFEEMENMTEEYNTQQLAAFNQVSLDDSTCELDGQIAEVSGEVSNDTDTRRSYSITILFTGEDNRRLESGYATVESVDPGETIVFDVGAFVTDASGEIRCTVGDVSRWEN